MAADRFHLADCSCDSCTVVRLIDEREQLRAEALRYRALLQRIARSSDSWGPLAKELIDG